MFILNIEEVNPKFLYSCERTEFIYLRNLGFFPISIKDNKYYFFRTEKLLSSLPNGGESNE